MLLGMRTSQSGGAAPPAGILYWGVDDLLWGAANQLQWG